MLSFTQDEKVFIVQLLIRAARADSKVDKKEKSYIMQVMGQLGIPESELVEIRREAEQLEMPGEEKKRMTILYFLLFLLRVDGRIGPLEEKLAINAGFELGFNEVLVRNLVQEMREHLSGDVPDEALLRHIRASLN